MTHPDENELPVGYESVRFDARTSLALPTTVARQSRKELECREEAQDQARRIEANRRQEEQTQAKHREKLAQATKLVKRPDFGAEPARGWHRVLPGLQALVDAGDDAKLRSADVEVRERHARVRERLIARGPDRRLATPIAWRDAIAELERTLPHFGEPTRLLRNALALGEATRRPVRVPPMLLLGPPGVGKTYFSHRVAEMMGAAHAAIAFDQPTAGSQLRGSDKYWSNSESGLLFNLICLGDCANPVILLDEIDKSSAGSGHRDLDPLAQLHGALEPETARRTVDISTDIEFDASLVTYIATANSLRGLGMPILSRLEIFGIEPPEPSDAVEIARAVVGEVLHRLSLGDTMRFDRKGLYVLAHLSPRLMMRTVEKAVAAAVAAGQGEVMESDLWAELGPDADGPRMH